MTGTDKKISELTTATAVGDTDALPALQSGGDVAMQMLLLAKYFRARRHTFSNAGVVVSSSDYYVAQTGTMSASATVSMPAANSVPAGWPLIVADESGTVSASACLVVTAHSGDTINGVTTNTIKDAYGWRCYISNGVNQWVHDAGIHSRSRSLYRDSGVTVASTTSVTTLLAGAYSIPANLLNASDQLMIVASGTFLNNTGANASATVSMGVGAATVFSATTGSQGAGANPRNWQITVLLDVRTLGIVSTSVIGLSGHADLPSGIGSTQWTGLGSAANHFVGTGTVSWDTTADAALTLTAQPSVNSANCSVKLNALSIIYIPKS